MNKLVESILKGAPVREAVLLESFDSDYVRSVKRYLEDGGETLWIIVEVGKPWDNEFDVEKLYVSDVDFDKDIVRLSRKPGGPVIDRSALDEVYLSKEDAELAIRQMDESKKMIEAVISDPEFVAWVNAQALDDFELPLEYRHGPNYIEVVGDNGGDVSTIRYSVDDFKKAQEIKEATDPVKLLPVRPGDSITALGDTATISEILFQSVEFGNRDKGGFVDPAADIEFKDEFGNYRHWQSWSDGGTLYLKRNGKTYEFPFEKET